MQSYVYSILFDIQKGKINIIQLQAVEKHTEKAARLCLVRYTTNTVSKYQGT